MELENALLQQNNNAEQFRIAKNADWEDAQNVALLSTSAKLTELAPHVKTQLLKDWLQEFANLTPVKSKTAKIAQMENAHCAILDITFCQTELAAFATKKKTTTEMVLGMDQESVKWLEIVQEEPTIIVNLLISMEVVSPAKLDIIWETLNAVFATRQEKFQTKPQELVTSTKTFAQLQIVSPAMEIHVQFVLQIITNSLTELASSQMIAQLKQDWVTELELVL